MAVVAVVVIFIQGGAMWSRLGLYEKYGYVGASNLAWGHWREIARRTQDEAKDVGASRLIVVTDGTDERPEVGDVWPQGLSYLLGSLSPRFLGRDDVGTFLWSSREPFLYLVTRGDGWAVTWPDRWAEEVETFNVGGVPVSLYSLPVSNMTALRNIPPFSCDVPFSNGVCLIGFDPPSLGADGQTLSLVTYWEFEGVTDEDREGYYQMFVHLLNDQDDRVGQTDGLGLASAVWEDDEFLIQKHTLPLPPGGPPEPYRIHLGFYSLWDGARAAAMDAGGRPIGDHVTLEASDLRSVPRVHLIGG